MSIHTVHISQNSWHSENTLLYNVLYFLKREHLAKNQIYRVKIQTEQIRNITSPYLPCTVISSKTKSFTA